MSYRDAIPDILPGSIWIPVGPPAPKVRVIAAAARHVVYRDAEVAYRPPVYPARIVMHERAFRAAFYPIYDRQQVRQQFTMSIANLGEFRVYWLPGVRRILARSVSCRRQFRVPDGATLIGTYGEPCEPAALFRDLDALLCVGAPATEAAA